MLLPPEALPLRMLGNLEWAWMFVMPLKICRRLAHKDRIFQRSQVSIAAETQQSAHTARFVCMVNVWAMLQVLFANSAKSLLCIKHGLHVIQRHAVVSLKVKSFPIQGITSSLWLFQSASALFASGRKTIDFVAGHGEVARWLRLFACRAAFFSRDALNRSADFRRMFSAAFRLTLSTPPSNTKSVAVINNEIAQWLGLSTTAAFFHRSILLH